MKVHIRFADEQRLVRDGRGEILILSEPVINRTCRELAVKAESLVDIRVEIQAKAISHTHILHMLERRVRRFGCWPEYPVEAEPKIAAHSNRADLDDPFLYLFQSILKGWRVLLRRRLRTLG